MSLHELRDRFAEQRARGAANQVTQEEEELILQTLGQMQTRYAGVEGRSEDDEDEEEDVIGSLTTPSRNGSVSRSSAFAQQRSSTRTVSTTSTTGLLPISGGRSNKRYSNNLFGSGAFRDHTYIRAAGLHRGGSSRSLVSVNSSDSAATKSRGLSPAGGRPMTPDQSSLLSSVPPSPNEPPTQDEIVPSVRSAPIDAQYSDSTLASNAAAFRMSKTFTPDALKRVSASLDDVLRRLEEAGEDEIVMPRTNPPSKVITDERRPQSEDSVSILIGLWSLISNTPSPKQPTSSDQTQYQPGTALSSDVRESMDNGDMRAGSPPLSTRPGTASPTPRLPGYIPGMPRPMTPRNVDLHDDLRSHSITPRAAGHYVSSSTSAIMVAGPSPLLHRRPSDFTSSTSQSRSDSPAISVKTTPFFARSVNGRFTPDSDSPPDHGPPSSGRIRPSSPLSGTAYQSIAVNTPSRPSTPSNVTWAVHGKSQERIGSPVDAAKSDLSRNGSIANSSSTARNSPGSLNGPLDRLAPLLRSAMTPGSPSSGSPSPGSPVQHSRASTNGQYSTLSNGHSDQDSPQSRSFISVPQVGQSSSGSTTANGLNTPPQSRRMSKQASMTNSPFSLSLGPARAGLYSPHANSSHSSLGSDGSSYHTWDGDGKRDRVLDLLTDLESERSVWHDIPDASGSLTTAPSRGDDEEIICHYAGLTKEDFTAIQQKLIDAVQAKLTSSESFNRTPSLRRRRPSTARSNYSFSERENRVCVSHYAFVHEANKGGI